MGQYFHFLNKAVVDFIMNCSLFSGYGLPLEKGDVSLPSQVLRQLRSIRTAGGVKHLQEQVDRLNTMLDEMKEKLRQVHN